MLKAEAFFAPTGNRIEQGERNGGFDGVHPFHGGRRAGDVIHHDRQHQHHLHRQHIIAGQRQDIGDEAFVPQHPAQTLANRRFHRRELPCRQIPGVKRGAGDKQRGAGAAHQAKIILQQPAAQQRANHRAGAILHHQDGEKAAALMRTHQLNHQRRPRRIEQCTAESGEYAREPQHPRLMGDGHRRETAGTHQHTGDDHRFRAEAVGDGAAKDA